MRKARAEIAGEKGRVSKKRNGYPPRRDFEFFKKTDTNAPPASGRAKNRENSFFLIFLLTYIYMCGKMYLTNYILWRIL